MSPLARLLEKFCSRELRVLHYPETYVVSGLHFASARGYMAKHVYSCDHPPTLSLRLHPTVLRQPYSARHVRLRTALQSSLGSGTVTGRTSGKHTCPDNVVWKAAFCATVFNNERELATPRQLFLESARHPGSEQLFRTLVCDVREHSGRSKQQACQATVFMMMCSQLTQTPATTEISTKISWPFQRYCTERGNRANFRAVTPGPPSPPPPPPLLCDLGLL